MRKILFATLILLSILAVVAIAQKKTVIKLYDDNTWEKVSEEDAAPKLTIEETWAEFGKALKNKDKDKVLTFFDFPFEIRIDLNEAKITKVKNSNKKNYINSIDYVCQNDYCKLHGNLSKKKLLSKYNILFNKKVISRILDMSVDEYSKKASKKLGGERVYGYTFLVNTTHNVISTKKINNKTKYSVKKRPGKNKVEFYWVNIDGKFKIYIIGITGIWEPNEYE